MTEMRHFGTISVQRRPPSSSLNPGVSKIISKRGFHRLSQFTINVLALYRGATQ